MRLTQEDRNVPRFRITGPPLENLYVGQNFFQRPTSGTFVKQPASSNRVTATQASYPMSLLWEVCCITPLHTPTRQQVPYNDQGPGPRSLRTTTIKGAVSISGLTFR